MVRKFSERYQGPADLPQRIPVFPLRGAILLPRATLPLNIFEPRYLQMVEDVVSTSRVMGMLQPAGGDEESPPGRAAPLRRVGCAGRVTGYQELDEGRMLISLTGIVRFTLVEEVPFEKPYRICTVSYDRFTGDFAAGAGEDDVDRPGLLKTLKAYLEARNLKADWAAISKSSNETLINSLAIVSPFGPEEKQALLEAANLKDRAEMLVALAEMELAASPGGSGSTLQ
ncbi:MAG: LON peptidase substrate-binding domain-containing protein [Hyphomonadaceae bacterium]|nr:LON peptidase substrate-binding domain-containing protein [Hyphomonadaceae bacterium]